VCEFLSEGGGEEEEEEEERRIIEGSIEVQFQVYL
jgi:hypothetical protein